MNNKAGAFFAALALLVLGSCATRVNDELSRIENVVVIYAENRSFDHLYGLFPGADGIANATAEQKAQLDQDGKPLPSLPATYDPVQKGALRADLPTAGLPNGPFRIDAPPINRKWSELLPNPIHAYYQNREQINGGRNNLFAAMSNVGGWTMGYYDGSQFKLWQWAKDYTLADRFFMGAFGGSYLNHQYLICACAPVHAGAPASMRAVLDADGRLTKKPGSPSANVGAVQVVSGGGGQVGPDDLSVNTTQPPWQPSGVPPADGGSLDAADPKGTPGSGQPLPAQTQRTIGDTLSAKNVSWAWYAGGWNAALADGRQAPSVKRQVIYARGEGSPMFQPHHQPLNYYARFAPGTADRARHLKDEKDLLEAIDKGTLPQVAFFKPAGRYTEHPSYTDVVSGDEHIAMLLERLKKSPQWPKMAVIVTYDENGGFWDHVPPPSGPGWGDRWGPGSRVPAIIVSPFAKRGYVDKTPYDTTSILKFITRRFDLDPLPGVRQNTGDLTNAFAF